MAKSSKLFFQVQEPCYLCSLFTTQLLKYMPCIYSLSLNCYLHYHSEATLHGTIMTFSQCWFSSTSATFDADTGCPTFFPYFKSFHFCFQRWLLLSIHLLLMFQFLQTAQAVLYLIVTLTPWMVWRWFLPIALCTSHVLILMTLHLYC